MVDTTIETPIPLTQAADELPRRRGRRNRHVSTLFRWSTVGCKGIILETIQVGGTRCTSREALQRFDERLSQPREGEAGCLGSGRLRSASRRLRDSERAGAELKSSGGEGGLSYGLSHHARGRAVGQGNGSVGVHSSDGPGWSPSTSLESRIVMQPKQGARELHPDSKPVATLFSVVESDGLTVAPDSTPSSAAERSREAPSHGCAVAIATDTPNPFDPKRLRIRQDPAPPSASTGSSHRPGPQALERVVRPDPSRPRPPARDLRPRAEGGPGDLPRRARRSGRSWRRKRHSRPRMLVLAVNRAGRRSSGRSGSPAPTARSTVGAERDGRRDPGADVVGPGLGEHGPRGLRDLRGAPASTPSRSGRRSRCREILKVAFRGKMIDSMDHPVLKRLRGEV